MKNLLPNYNYIASDDFKPREDFSLYSAFYLLKWGHEPLRS